MVVFVVLTFSAVVSVGGAVHVGIHADSWVEVPIVLLLSLLGVACLDMLRTVAAAAVKLRIEA